MMKSATLALGAALIATTGTVALAHDGSRIDRIQERQYHDIMQKRQTGQLTRREHAALMAEQARIAEFERRAKADGHLSGAERRRILEAQHAARSHINDLSSNGRVNYWRHWKSSFGYGSRHGS
ncbi:MAG TPA: hypothetical protein VFV47_10835 [Hyphomicrobiaceae bacterium]|nr:hypothetical protein [Hyphomicrobiaceae bacterium]